MASVSTSPRILVLDDDDSIRSSLEIALRGEGYEVRTEPNGSSIPEVAEVFRPDLAILDVRLPEGPDGYEIARILRRSSDLPIIFLTAADSHEERRAGFGVGADDYVPKPFSVEELLWRTHAQLRRSGRVEARVRQIGDLLIDNDTRTVVMAGEKVDLTRTEWRLLGALAEKPGRVLSKAQLLHQIWDVDAHDENLVEAHISLLRRKLEAKGPRLIQTVRGMGYVLRA